MASTATLGVETRVRKRTRENRDANAGESIPGLLNDIVITHVLRSEYFDDPADLARLPAVSSAMRDAVAATGLEFEELDEDEAVWRGCFSAVERQLRGGGMSRQEALCEVAARNGNLVQLMELREKGYPWDEQTCREVAKSGQLEALQWLRANGCPWEVMTCWAAARCGHLEMLQWARANGCPWHMDVCSYAARGGHLEVLQWARANGCPWNGWTITYAEPNGHDDVVLWVNANGGGAPESGWSLPESGWREFI
jgi:hypothetical protein